MILLLTMAAQAGGVTATAGGAAGIGQALTPAADFRLGYMPASVFQAELEAGLLGDALWLPRVNLQLNSRSERVVRGTFGGGGGVMLGVPEPIPLVHIGPGLDVRLTKRLALHADARYLLELGGGRIAERSGAELTAGLTFRWVREREEPEPILVVAEQPQVAPTPPPASINVTPPSARIWLPHPACAWLSVSDLSRAGVRIEPGVPLRISADGYLPTEVTYSPGMTIALELAPSQGTLVVVAEPGDTIIYEGSALPVDDDGVAVLNAKTGMISVTVSGGGRTETLEDLIANGHATWMRVRPAPKVHIMFEVNSAMVLEEDIPRLEKLAEKLGEYHLTVQGAYSPEGSREHNINLARQRAQKVAEVLEDHGVSQERLHLLEPALPLDDVPLHKQRYVIVRPVGEPP